MTMTEETATGITRKRCRNPRCRLKLKGPTDNDHKAFCCRGCYEGLWGHRPTCAYYLLWMTLHRSCPMPRRSRAIPLKYRHS